MTDTPDLEELARRYLDLWQDQVTATAADPDFALAVQRVLGSMTPATLASMHAMTLWNEVLQTCMAMSREESARKANDQGAESSRDDGKPPREHPGEHPGGYPARRAEAASPGAASSAAASHDRGADMDDIAGRIAALEERIARLESKPAGARRSSGKRGGRGSA